MAALSKYRAQLPQLADRLLLTDGGLETTLIFHDGIDLPDFAAFHLVNESPEIDIGAPVELASQYAQLLKDLPRVNVMGGCCGTDHRHVEEIARTCGPFFRTTT